MTKPEGFVPAEARAAALKGCGEAALRVYAKDQIGDLIPEIVAYTTERTNATPNRPDLVQAEVLAKYGVVICLQATVAFMMDPGDGTPALLAGAGLQHMTSPRMLELHKGVLHDQVFGRLRQLLAEMDGDEA